MSSKEVTELRKAGKLKEAFDLAKQDYESDPTNIWNKRSLGWVYYEFFKKYSVPEHLEIFIDYLKKLKLLEFPSDEKMIFDNCAYQIGKMIYALAKEDPINNTKIDEIFEIIKDFHFSKPSEPYSYIYKAFHQINEKWKNYIKFVEWWNFDNFTSLDYLPIEINGKKTMSIVEKAVIAYSKQLIDEKKFEDFFDDESRDNMLNARQRILNLHAELDGSNVPHPVFEMKKLYDSLWARVENKVDAEPRIRNFLPNLDKLIKSHPEYLFTQFYKAKLLIALGDKDNVLSAFLPFAIMKRNDFWVWSSLAEVFENDDNMKTACFCKALSLKSPENFLVKIRQHLAELLIKQGLYSNAKYEIEHILSTRKENNWVVPSHIIEWTKQSWYQEATKPESNFDFYNSKKHLAEGILYQDVPEELILVEFVNQNKGVLNFIKDRSKSGFFKYSGLISNPEIGDLLWVKFIGDRRDDFFKVACIRKAENDTTCPAKKIITGKFRLSRKGDFGFIDDVYVDPKFVKSNNLSDDQEITITAILTFNKKRNDWGWKAIQV